jgi:hypothetical protein
MSRSNPTETLSNPSTKFIDWSGSEGKFKYYDKEKKENVFIELPFTFIPLDILSTCKGYNDQEKVGYYSNEVRSTKKEPFTVRTKNGIVMTGLYEQVKEKLAPKGLKYVQSVYVAIKEEGKGLVIANLQLTGSALGPFINFCDGKKVTEIGVTVKSANPMKKGATKYFEPVYEVMPVSEATNKVASELDAELQEYLTAYFAKTSTPVSEYADVVDENQDNGLNAKPTPAKSDYQLSDTLKDEIANSYDDDDLPF